MVVCEKYFGTIQQILVDFVLIILFVIDIVVTKIIGRFVHSATVIGPSRFEKGFI